MTYKGANATTNILNISKLTQNHLITKKHNVQCLSHSPSGAYSHRHCLMTFDLTQLLFLADCDIMCRKLCPCLY